LVAPEVEEVEEVPTELNANDKKGKKRNKKKRNKKGE
jgi:hypothetical protein